MAASPRALTPGAQVAGWTVKNLEYHVVSDTVFIWLEKDHLHCSFFIPSLVLMKGDEVRFVVEMLFKEERKHGQHRGAASASHSRPNAQSPASQLARGTAAHPFAGLGAQSLGAIPLAALAQQATLAQQALTPGALALQQAQVSQQIHLQSLAVQRQLTPAQEKVHIPHAGMRPGEIRAIRAWIVGLGCVLFSLNGTRWEPGQPVEGDVDLGTGRHSESGGVYAFKPLQFMRLVQLVHHRAAPVAFGQVDLWGEVVEHQWGYRAQYARIVSLDAVYATQIGSRTKTEDATLLQQLQAAYRVGGADDPPAAASS